MHTTLVQDRELCADARQHERRLLDLAAQVDVLPGHHRHGLGLKIQGAARGSCALLAGVPAGTTVVQLELVTANDGQVCHNQVQLYVSMYVRAHDLCMTCYCVAVDHCKRATTTTHSPH